MRGRKRDAVGKFGFEREKLRRDPRGWLGQKHYNECGVAQKYEYCLTCSQCYALKFQSSITSTPQKIGCQRLDLIIH